MMERNYARAIPKKRAYEGQRTITLPDLAEIQKTSFHRFLTKGLAEELKNFSPVTDYTGRLELYFLHDHYTFEEHQEANKAKTPMEARFNEQSYTKKLYIKVRFVNRDTGEIKESKMFMRWLIQTVPLGILGVPTSWLVLTVIKPNEVPSL